MPINFMETDAPDNCISGIKLTEDADALRVTFRWPQAIAQVYVFKTGGEFDIETAELSHARLFTQQEYKRQGGFMDKKSPGAHTYYFFPFIRENGEDVLVVPADGQNKISCVTGQLPIYFSIKEKKALFTGEKTYAITLACEQGAEAETVCYVVKEGGYPAGVRDGTVYFFGEPLVPGRESVSRVKVKKNEFIRLFIYGEEAETQYSLKMVGVDDGAIR